MSQDFFSFERVLRELAMEEEELKKLVSEGEIRAFRDQDKMKFKREDVERFKRSHGEGEGDETLEEEDLPEELVFDEDDADQEVGMATAAISDDSFLEEEDAPLELEEAEPEATSRRSRVSTTTAARRPRVVVEEEAATEGPVWMAALMICAALLIFGLFVGMDAVRAQPSGLTEGIANWVRETFLS